MPRKSNKTKTLTECFLAENAKGRRNWFFALNPKDQNELLEFRETYYAQDTRNVSISEIFRTYIQGKYGVGKTTFSEWMREHGEKASG